MVEQATHPGRAQVVIEMWSDLGCPWCYLAKHRLGTAIAQRRPHTADALAGVAESVGLDGRRVHAILASDEYADRVRADRAEGVEPGATGVPFVVVGRRGAAPGAQEVSAYGRLLEQVGGPAPGTTTTAVSTTTTW